MTLSLFFNLGLLLLSASLMGMESTQELHLVQQGIAALCEHSIYFGYSYSATLKALACVNKVYAAKITTANKTKQDTLHQEVMKLCQNLHPFDNENFVYNWVGDACGWKQPFCIKCLSPEQCACALPTTEAALYRAQCTINGFDIVQENGGWLWKPRQSIAIYKTGIESPLLQRIVSLNIYDTEHNSSRADWRGLHIPASYIHPVQSDIIPYSSRPTFNPDDSIGIYEITSKYLPYKDSTYEDSPHLYHDNAVQQCIDPEGTLKKFNVQILFDATAHSWDVYSLAGISYMPKFVDTLLKAEKKERFGTCIHIYVDKALSDVYNFHPLDIQVLRHMLLNKQTDYRIPASIHPDQIPVPVSIYALFLYDRTDYRAFLAAARCAQIGGASEEIIWHFLSPYETTRHGYNNLGIYISPFGRVFRYKEFLRQTTDIDPLPILTKYTINNINEFHKEIIYTYHRDIVLQPKYNPEYPFLDYFIETLRKSNTWCKLCVWTRQYSQSLSYTCTQEHIIEAHDDDTLPFIPHHSWYMVPFAQSTKLAIIIGSMLHHIQKIDNKSEVQSVPLLTDTEHQKGYTIEDIENIASDDTITVHIKPVRWWEHFFRPIKKIYLNSLQVKQGWNINQECNPFTILQPLFLTWFNTIKSLLIPHPIDK